MKKREVSAQAVARRLRSRWRMRVGVVAVAVIVTVYVLRKRLSATDTREAQRVATCRSHIAGEQWTEFETAHCDEDPVLQDEADTARCRPIAARVAVIQLADDRVSDAALRDMENTSACHAVSTRTMLATAREQFHKGVEDHCAQMEHAALTSAWVALRTLVSHTECIDRPARRKLLERLHARCRDALSVNRGLSLHAPTGRPSLFGDHAMHLNLPLDTNGVPAGSTDLPAPRGDPTAEAFASALCARIDARGDLIIETVVREPSLFKGHTAHDYLEQSATILVAGLGVLRDRLGFAKQLTPRRWESSEPMPGHIRLILEPRGAAVEESHDVRGALIHQPVRWSAEAIDEDGLTVPDSRLSQDDELQVVAEHVRAPVLGVMGPP